jgi:TatA/E family protein of Tat protein translocase
MLIGDTVSMAFFGPGGVGGLELIAFFALVLLFFGPKRLPQLSRSIGKSIRGFRQGLNDIKEDIEKADQPSPGAGGDVDEDDADDEDSAMESAGKKDSVAPHKTDGK